MYCLFQCKEWGFLLKKLFGVTLGTGDYGHLTVEHSAMLFRQFGSFREYSGQGFEASHKLHRAIFSRATNHDASVPGQSFECQAAKLLSILSIVSYKCFLFKFKWIRSSPTIMLMSYWDWDTCLDKQENAFYQVNNHVMDTTIMSDNVVWDIYSRAEPQWDWDQPLRQAAAPLFISVSRY